MSIIAPWGVGRAETLPGQLWDCLWVCERFANAFHPNRPGLGAIHAYEWTFQTTPYEFAGSLCVFLTLLGVGRIRHYARTLVVFAIALYAYLSARWNSQLFTTGILLTNYIQQVGRYEQAEDDVAISHCMDGRVPARVFASWLS